MQASVTRVSVSSHVPTSACVAFVCLCLCACTCVLVRASRRHVHTLRFAVAPGVKVFIEPRAMLTVVGTVMDWKEDALSAEFVFTNPNAKSLCGCGESFSV